MSPQPNPELDRLAREYWDHLLRTSPMNATLIGVHDYDHLFDEISREAEDADIAALRGFVAAAEAIDPETLTPDERITRDVLIFEASTDADAKETRAAEWEVSHIFGTQTALPVFFPQMTLTEPDHALAMVERLRNLGRYYDQAAERLREGVSKGLVPMRSTAEKSADQIDTLLAQAPNPILQVAAPEGWDGEASWREDLARAFADHVAPAMARWRDTIRDIVLPAARPDEKPGVCHLPGGDEAYAKALYRFTSTRLTPEEIHQIGLDQIAKLADEYREIAGSVLGTTDLQEIFTRMREDPELRYREAEPIVAAGEKAVEKAKAVMGDWFGRLPKADCVVVSTVHGPAAYYFPPASDGSRPGTFFVNAADPAKWATYEMEALAYHEAIPGHHLQLAISTELEGIPEFRKYAILSAYAEGWGLYSERLADEMGLYGSQLDRIGMLSADSLRAGRLVVDTGLHALGWTRQQAIDFFKENSPMSQVGIENEVDRYIALPGQATAYMIGRLEIMRMRREAMETLGSRFDIKGFHDTVLGSGLVPLETLERMIGDWVTSVQAA
ncbi:MAG TPA: DUF885 domain-containing protein [Acidimicrobiia bacterium]